MVGALIDYEESLAIRRRRADTDPGSADLQNAVWDGLDKLGDGKLQAGDVAGVLRAYEESLAIARGNLAERSLRQPEQDR